MYLDLLLIATFTLCMWNLLSLNIHIFQLNHYKNKFQIDWIKKNFKKIAKKSLLFFVGIISLLLFKNVGKVIASILFIIGFFINRRKNEKINLVYTNRVKRLIGTAYIGYLIIFIATYRLTNNYVIAYISLEVCSILAPILMLVFNFINLPINKIINNKYVKEAKKKIQSMPNLIVIGVTGSFGKTSTKNYLYKILSSQYNVLITPKNYNTLLGVSKTIRENLKATHEVFICEMGADNVGEIEAICKLVKPKYGILTSIGPQHLETFGSIENIIKTKFELVDSIKDKGCVFLNYDNEYIKNQKCDKNPVTYGIENKKVDFYAYDIEANKNGLEFKVKENEEEYNFSTGILGKHNVQNIVGCIALARTLGIDMKKINQRVKQIESVPHRLQLIKGEKYSMIDDAYNSNPAGAKSALETLKSFKDEYKILVTPGMIELGEKQYECNFEFGELAAKVCDYVILVGKDQTKPIYDGLIKKKYKKDKIEIIEDVKEAFTIITELESDGKHKVALFENDLPDNY